MKFRSFQKGYFASDTCTVMLLHFIFSLVTVAALPLNNSNSIRDNQSSLNNSILCSADSPTDSIDRKRISHKIQLGKLKLVIFSIPKRKN